MDKENMKTPTKQSMLDANKESSINVSRATKKAVLNVIKNSGNPVGTKHIAEKTGLSHRTVCRALTTLEPEGNFKIYKTRGWLILPTQK